MSGKGGDVRLYMPDIKGGEKKTSMASVIRAVIACALYMVVGPSLIILNKVILKDLGFDYPMSVSCMGLVASSLVAVVQVHFLKSDPLTHKKYVTNEFVLKRILPVALASAVTLASGNIVYLHLSVAFIQILKAFTPVITLCVLVVCRVDTPSTKVTMAVVVIALSTAAAAYGELHFSLLGFLIMMTSSFGEAIKLVLTQQLLSGEVRFSLVETQYFLSPACIACLMVPMLYSEIPEMIQKQSYHIVSQFPFHFLTAALMGALVNFLAVFVIQTTSSLTLKVLATARSAGLVLFCAMFLGEHVTFFQTVCYTISLIAFAYYNLVKM